MEDDVIIEAGDAQDLS